MQSLSARAGASLHIFSVARSWVQVGQVVMTGEWDNEDAKEVLQLGMGGCAQIDAYMRQCLREALSGDSMDE